jgi:hypothetical protein
MSWLGDTLGLDGNSALGSIAGVLTAQSQYDAQARGAVAQASLAANSANFQASIAQQGFLVLVVGGILLAGVIVLVKVKRNG